jgi:hypothetical protein
MDATDGEILQVDPNCGSDLHQTYCECRSIFANLREVAHASQDFSLERHPIGGMSCQRHHEGPSCISTPHLRKQAQVAILSATHYPDSECKNYQLPRVLVSTIHLGGLTK